MNLITQGLAAAATLVLVACGGGTKAPSPAGNLIGTPTVVATLTAAQIDAFTAGYGLQALTEPAKCDVKVVQINYQTPGVKPGEMSNASAAILIPSGPGFAGPLPLVAYGRATNLDRTHTVADPTASETRLLLIFFASQGYPVVASDYLGYALSAHPYHPYLHAITEASSELDAIRAARHAAGPLGLTLDGRIMLAGYSQGGHTAMATQRAIEAAHTGEFNLVASALLAGPYHMSAALRDGIATSMIGVQSFLPFEITAWQKIYGDVYASTGDVFRPPYDATIETLFPSSDFAHLDSHLPPGTGQQARDAMFTAAFVADLATNPDNGAFRAAQRQDLLDWTPRVPTLLAGGTGDPVVSFTLNAQAAYDLFRGAGATDVTLLDLDPVIRAKYAALLANAPDTYRNNYHSNFESTFCCQAAKDFFDLHR